VRAIRWGLAFCSLAMSCGYFATDTQDAVAKECRFIDVRKRTVELRFPGLHKRLLDFLRFDHISMAGDKLQIVCSDSLMRDVPYVDKDITFVLALWREILASITLTGKLDTAMQLLGGHVLKNGAAIFAKDNVDSMVSSLRKLGLRYIFSPSARRLHVGDVEIVPLLFWPDNLPVDSSRDKNLLYSYVGSSKSPLRKKVCRLRSCSDVTIKDRGLFFGRIAEHLKPQYRAEYCDILSRSRFALCPAGATPITIRISDSIWAGAIPVIIANQIAMPPGVDWKSCVLIVKESEVPNLDKIIRAIPREREENMRAACRNLVNKLQNDPAYFIRAYFAERLKS